MKPFLDEEFMLTNSTASRLYHDYAKQLPIIDYHCHISPQEIAEDLSYDSISRVWLGGDHYKWRLMRANGLAEEEVTGLHEKDWEGLFYNFAACLPKAVDNPVYHWAHLELKRYFGINETLTPKTAEKIYKDCNKKLTEPGMSVRGIIDQSKVELICTTDDPVDSLKWHRMIQQDKGCRVRVLPAFRPDKVLNIEQDGFGEYIQKLGDSAGFKIDSLALLEKALADRIDFFASMGCTASDHALENCSYLPASQTVVESIFAKKMAGNSLNEEEVCQYRSYLLTQLGKEYAQKDWVMQIHFGCQRNNNTKMFKQLGPDTGFDSMNGDGRPGELAKLLDAMDTTGNLPKTILYSLNPADTEILVTIAGCFMTDSGCPGKVQVGSAWWFNDTKRGIENQLSVFANGTLLGNFIGMLTDSRSFLSYTRHEYFRRILCNYLGTLVENGEYPADFEILGQLVQDICYYNTRRFFGFDNALGRLSG